MTREGNAAYYRSAASVAYKVGDIEKCVELCRCGVVLAEAEAEGDQVWHLRTQWSLCLSYQGHFAEALSVVDRPMLTDGVSIATRARVLNQKGHVHSCAGNFSLARIDLDEALALANAANLTPLVGEILVCRSALFFYLRQYDEVGNCARTALEIAEQHHLLLLEASACAGIAKYAMYTGRQAEAITWFTRALAIYEKEGAAFYADIMKSELGCCHFTLREDDKALHYFTQALAASRASGARSSLHIDLANRGALHLRHGEYAAAIAHFQEALEIARELGDNISVAKWLENLAMTYSRMGNPAISSSFQKQAEEASARVGKARAAAVL